MKFKLLILFSIFLIQSSLVIAQECTTPGQTPSTAFPVCGTNVFSQDNVPICSSHNLYVPQCNDGANYANKNPFFYKFTCFESGTLGFVITPNDLGDDYDWQLYDVTGLDPNQIFTNRNIIVTGNWAGNPGPTGTSATGVNFIQCASSPTGSESRFAAMPNLVKGREYILLVSHYTNTQSGYKLSFGGGTASITDPKIPDLKSVSTSCDASKIYIKLNKPMKCKSIASDGSDFLISSGASIVSATAVGCTNGFDTDSVVLTLSGPLAAGDYTVAIKVGTDNNTIVDNCDRSIPVGRSLPFKVTILLPTPMDSMAAVSCAPQSLQLIFKKKILCNTIASDGSNFKITGPFPVTVISAEGDCTEGGSNVINLKLSAPIVHDGTYQIILQPGSLGNSIYDECGLETPLGSSLSFKVKDTVSAKFNTTIAYGCKMDTLYFKHDGRNSVNQWNWSMDYAGNSTLQNPVGYFHIAGTKTITLKVSNGFCTDSSTQSFTWDHTLKAGFETINLLCPEDSAKFLDKSIGNIVSYSWDFNNGNTSTLKNPVAQKYPLSTYEKEFVIRQIVQNDMGCSDTAYQKLKVLQSCYIAVPTAFTPNGDGLNDYLYPLNAFKAKNLEFKVYNRTGQLIYSSKDWLQKWDGTFKGEPLDSGIFVWTLSYTHVDTGEKHFLKGSSVLIR